MACDDRVTAKLQDIDRLAYANSIVSASGRSGNAACVHATGTTLTGRHLRQRVTAVIRCVRGNRWAIALGSLAAAAVLLVSFATSESEPLPTVANVRRSRGRPPPLLWRMGMRPSRAPSAFLKAPSFTKIPMNTPLPPLWWMGTGAWRRVSRWIRCPL